MPMLYLRKRADRSAGGEMPEGGWPLAGISIVDSEHNKTAEPPAETSISPSKIAEGVKEGWLTVTNARPVVRPAGPTMDDWQSSQNGQPHVFMHYDSITFHTIEGDVTYKVVHQADKYVDSDDDTEKVTKAKYAEGNTRVDHFYLLELEG